MSVKQKLDNFYVPVNAPFDQHLRSNIPQLETQHFQSAIPQPET